MHILKKSDEQQINRNYNHARYETLVSLAELKELSKNPGRKLSITNFLFMLNTDSGRPGRELDLKSLSSIICGMKEDVARHARDVIRNVIDFEIDVWGEYREEVYSIVNGEANIQDQYLTNL